ncbi:hypothetical protein GCM10022237_28260 [Nocardioides ginsengisoli]
MTSPPFVKPVHDQVTLGASTVVIYAVEFWETGVRVLGIGAVDTLAPFAGLTTEPAFDVHEATIVMNADLGTRCEWILPTSQPVQTVTIGTVTYSASASTDASTSWRTCCSHI